MALIWHTRRDIHDESCESWQQNHFVFLPPLYLTTSSSQLPKVVNLRSVCEKNINCSILEGFAMKLLTKELLDNFPQKSKSIRP